MINKCIILTNEDKFLGKPKNDKNVYVHKILGLTSLERIILSAKENGIKDFCFVVNGKSQNIKESLDEKNLNVNTSFITSTDSSNLDPESITQLKSFIDKDNALLIKGEQIIDKRIYKELLNEEANLNEYEIIAAAGIHGNGSSDENPGIYICNKELFNQSNFNQNSQDLSLDTLLKKSQRLNSKGTYKIKKGFWHNIKDESDIKKAEKKLLKSCIKEADGFLSRNFTRPISLSLSRYFSKTSITPNQITYLNLIIGIVSAILVTSSAYFINIFGLLLFEFTVIFDGCDGEIARLKFKSSKKGAQIDTVIDFLIRVMFFTALGIVNLKFNHTSFDYFFSITTPILSAITMILTVVLLIKYDIPDEGCFSEENLKYQKTPDPFIRFLALLMKPEGFTSLFVILGIFRLYRVMLVLGAMGYIGFSIYNIITAVKTFRKRATN